MAATTTPTDVTPFSFDDRAVRVVMMQDEPWFVCTDVAASLGYSSPKDAASHLDDDEKGSATVRTPGGDQRVTVINESGLYSLVLRSRKPEAKRFAKWVTRDVLPAIRKTGRYEQAAVSTYSVQPSQTLSADQAAELRALLQEAAERLPSDRRASFMVRGWSKLKAHFGTDYRHIPAGMFPDALSLVARHIAAENASAPSIVHNRWLITIDEHGQEIARRVPENAVIGTPEALAQAIAGGGWPSRSVMPVLKGCMQYVQKQMGRPQKKEPAQPPLAGLEAPVKQLQR